VDGVGGSCCGRARCDPRRGRRPIFNSWQRESRAGVGLDVLPLRESRAGGCRHSDNEKFRNDLNHPEGCKMSERLLCELSNFSTSKLNTRVGALHPPQSNFNGSAGTLDLVSTTAKSPSWLQAECLPILPVFSFQRAEISPWCAVISSVHQLLRLVRFSFAQSRSTADY
jgi:hypothetical protein